MNNELVEGILILVQMIIAAYLLLEGNYGGVGLFALGSLLGETQGRVSKNMFSFDVTFKQ